LVLLGAAVRIFLLADFLEVLPTYWPWCAAIMFVLHPYIFRAKGKRHTFPSESMISLNVEAATACKADHMRHLIALGADVNSTCDHGKTALMRASRCGKASCIKKLISLGADVNLADDLGKTALMYALSDGRSAAAQVLICAGADVNATAVDGANPIKIATGYVRSNQDVVEALKAAGANEDV